MPMREQSQTHQNHTTMDRDGFRRWRSSMVEQLICNQQVAGSSPIASSAKERAEEQAEEQSEEQQEEMIAWTKPSSARRSPSREGLGGARVGALTLPLQSDLDGFPSGQREQTVNLSSLTSKVRILPRPRKYVRDSVSRKRCTESIGREHAGVAQLVELQPSKLVVAGSRPVSRSAHVAQLAEHVLGKDEVTRSIRVVGSRPV
jgi:hypothetical protein